MVETHQLAPPGIHFHHARETVVVEPLFVEGAQLGIINLTLGPDEGVVYETIRDDVSSSIRNLLLLERIAHAENALQETKKEQASRELRIAANIQTLVLPREPQVIGLEVAAKMQPAVNVGGDYYDVLPTAQGCWLGIGDVVGHGLRSGLIALMLQSAVSGLVKSGCAETPRDLINAANAMLFDNLRSRLESDDHMTLCLLKYATDGRVQFAGSHEEILVHRARTGRCERWQPKGVGAGLTPDVLSATTNQEFRLEKDDLLVLYTDGIVEARDVRDQSFGLLRLIEEIEMVARRPVGEICSHILHTVQTWMSTQQDDLTLVVARHTG